MATRAAVMSRLTVEEFYAWDSGEDTHYELINGVPVAMAPPSGAHSIIIMNLGRRIDEALDRKRPCTVRPEAGIVVPDRDSTCYVADLAVTCTPHAPGQQAIPNPILIVEILSPSTERRDRWTKLADYRALPSVQEIVLIDQVQPYAEIHRRFSEDKWLTDLLRGANAVLRLDSIGLELPLSVVYAQIVFEAEDPT